MSDTETPLYYIAGKVKAGHKDALTVFIGPCIAKKNEVQENSNVDYVINYEELVALFNVKDIKVQDCKEEKFDIESSRQGRGFCIAGGVGAAVSKVLETKDLAKPHIINGLNKEAIRQLKRIVEDQKCAEGNLIEVMGCEGGCIGGNATVCISKVSIKAVKALSEQSKDITEK